MVLAARNKLLVGHSHLSVHIYFYYIITRIYGCVPPGIDFNFFFFANTGSVPNKTGTYAGGQTGTYVPDSFDRSCNAPTRSAAKVLPAINIRNDIGSANTGPKKKRRVIQTSNHSSMDLDKQNQPQPNVLPTKSHNVIQTISDDNMSHEPSCDELEHGKSVLVESDRSTRSNTDSEKDDDETVILSEKLKETCHQVAQKTIFTEHLPWYSLTEGCCVQI